MFYRQGFKAHANNVLLQLLIIEVSRKCNPISELTFNGILHVLLITGISVTFFSLKSVKSLVLSVHMNRVHVDGRFRNTLKMDL